jgi:hypothetical protein
LQPDVISEKFIRKNRMYIRYISNSWNLYSDIENDSLWASPDYKEDMISLRLILISNDANFYKSVYDPQAEEGINCICNQNGSDNLCAISCTRNSCERWNKKTAIAGKMQWQICLDFNRDTFLTTEKLISVSFNTKEVFWKYLIFNIVDKEEIAIIDTNSEVQFLRGEKEQFPDAKEAVSFISNKKIPLSENDAHQFRLIIKKGGIEKNIIKRLPVATASGIRYKDSSKKELMSNIFVCT